MPSCRTLYSSPYRFRSLWFRFDLIPDLSRASLLDFSFPISPSLLSFLIPSKSRLCFCFLRRDRRRRLSFLFPSCVSVAEQSLKVPRLCLSSFSYGIAWSMYDPIRRMSCIREFEIARQKFLFILEVDRGSFLFPTGPFFFDFPTLIPLSFTLTRDFGTRPSKTFYFSFV